ncbi:MAG: lactate racemase [Thermoproteota archaeon]|nr:lactate racemase [Thermoproteota archaeon]
MLQNESSFIAAELILMVETWLFFGKTEIPVRIPDENLIGIVEPPLREGSSNPKEEILRAIENPLGSQRLEEIVKPGKRIAIVVDDNTRTTPNNLILQSLLQKLEQSGIRNEDITIIIGCGMHSMKHEDSQNLIDEIVIGKVKTLIHDCNSQDLVFLGTTSFGTKVYVNKVFADADVRILTGDVGLHYYAGYSGGRKSVLPAIAGATTIKSNHAFLLNANARTGNLDGNPVHLDMEEAASLAKVDFALNVVLNTRGEVVKAFAGDLDQVFFESVKLVDEISKVTIERKADIAIVGVGGHPHDNSLYKSYKGIDSVLGVMSNNGVIILAAECSEGYGERVFYDWTMKFKSIVEIEREIKRNFAIGGHVAYYLMRALEGVKIILVSIMPDYYATGVFRLRTAKTLNSAVDAAFRITGRKGKILVVPHGEATLPIVKTQNQI